MKKILSFSILVCLLLIQGCAGEGRWISMERKPHTPCEVKMTQRISYDKNYRIGEKKSAFIGQEIIRVKEHTHIDKNVEYIKSFIAPNDLIIEAKYRPEDYKINIAANSKYQTDEMIIIDKYPHFLIKLSNQSSDYRKRRKEWGVLVTCDGTVNKSALYSYYDESLFYPSVITFTPNINILNDKFIAQKEFKEIKDLNVISGMMYELIYSGKNDVSLNATYREYSSDNLARPAFFQNLTYQANAKQIRFKDFVIQVHNVTNEQIIYTILEDGLK